MSGHPFTAGRKSRSPRANRLAATAAALTDDDVALTDDDVAAADAAGSWRPAPVDVGQVLGSSPGLFSRLCRVTFHITTREGRLTWQDWCGCGWQPLFVAIDPSVWACPLWLVSGLFPTILPFVPTCHNTYSTAPCT